MARLIGVFFTSLLIAAVLTLIPTNPAAAFARQDAETPTESESSDTPFGSVDGPSNVVTFDAENQSGGTVEVVVDATREHIEHSGNLPCASWFDEPQPDGAIILVCAYSYHCAGERIDDVISGRVAGLDAGAYSEYVAYRTDMLNNIMDSFVPWWFGIDPFDPDDVSDAILDLELGDPASSLLIPVFYYCRVGTDGPIEIADPVYGVDFGWDTDIATEYEINTIRFDLVDELHERMLFNEPELRAIPPLENGFTYVRFPMWLWLDEPLTFEYLWAESDLQTIRLAARATLDYVEWNLGDTTIDCAIDDMRAYVGPDPTVDPPPCHHVFTQLESFELTATAHYIIEEQISYRLSRSGAYPDTPWIPHPTQPTIGITGSTGNIDVHQLVSLNVVNADS